MKKKAAFFRIACKDVYIYFSFAGFLVGVLGTCFPGIHGLHWSYGAGIGLISLSYVSYRLFRLWWIMRTGVIVPVEVLYERTTPFYPSSLEIRYKYIFEGQTYRNSKEVFPEELDEVAAIIDPKNPEKHFLIY